ncbi:MAG: alpha/beta hydrolase [Chloroflexi bacterium]|nr:alpha/beta hydrolase [Chloroflexota bacterium]
MSFPFFGESLELNETTRAAADGSFVSLPDGVTHYEFGGPHTGVPVVLVHGFSVPYYIFDPTFDFLIQAGFRVLRYDLFGRGGSDRPDVTYTIDLFTRQLRDLLDALDLHGPVSLVGLSMGGPVTAAFTARHPERVSHNVWIDPAGVHPVALRGLRLLKLPLVGEVALGLGGERMVKGAAEGFFDPQLVEEFQARYRVQMQFKGFRRAILSTMRNGMLGDFSETYRRVGALGKPAQLFWGREDTTVPFAYSADLLKWVPQAEFHAFDGCGHTPHLERPDEFNQLLVKFLSHSM